MELFPISNLIKINTNLKRFRKTLLKKRTHINPQNCHLHTTQTTTITNTSHPNSHLASQTVVSLWL